jgi:hypothetical protein
VLREAREGAKELERAKKASREKQRRQDAEVDADYEVDGLDEDHLPSEVLEALAAEKDANDKDASEEDDHRALQRRIVSQQLRALHEKPSKKKKFGQGRSVGGGVVVKSLKQSGQAMGHNNLSASRSFLAKRLGMRERSYKGLDQWRRRP